MYSLAVILWFLICELNRVVDIVFGGVIAMVYYAGITNGNGVWRYIAVDVCARTYHYVIADSDAANDDGIDANLDVIADGGNALPLPTVLLSDSHALVDIDVLA